jgi:hypothetical protein
MPDDRATGRPKQETKGGYPAGSKPVSEMKPPPASVTKPKQKAS